MRVVGIVVLAVLVGVLVLDIVGTLLFAPGVGLDAGQLLWRAVVTVVAVAAIVLLARRTSPPE